MFDIIIPCKALHWTVAVVFESPTEDTVVNEKGVEKESTFWVLFAEVIVV